MKPVNQSRSLVKGALLLTVAALITKILSAVYRIPFQNIVGDTGFYIYQQVYPIYGVALVLSTTGFPVVLSKLYLEQKNKEEQGRLMLVATVFLTVIGILAFVSLYYGAEWIAQLMNDPNLAVLIKVISIVFLIIPFSALLRGYYQGEGNMVPTAYSQVGEQIIRVSTILVIAVLFVRANYSLYEVGAGALFGSVTGAIIGAGILLTFLWVKKDTRKIHMRLGQLLPVRSTMSTMRTLAIQGFAICVSSMLLLFMQLADSLNLYSMLISTGINGEDAKVMKGIYDRGQPLIQLGSVVATSMSLSLVPLIASERVRNEVRLLNSKIDLAIRVSFIIGLGATVGLITIMEPTNIMLFENREGTNVLAILSITVLISSVVITFISILQGLGFTIFPAMVVLVGFVLKYVGNILLVHQYGTLGAAVASVIALGIIFMMLMIKLYMTVRKKPFTLIFLLKAVLASVSMYIVLKGYLSITDFTYLYGHERAIASVQSLSAVFIGGLIYMLVVIRTKVFSIEELTLLPFGSKIMYLFPKRNRG